MGVVRRWRLAPGLGGIPLLSIAITSVMMNITWLTWVSLAPCIRIVVSETSSRRLHTSLMTVHSCDVSFRAFWGCCRKYSLIGFFKARRRSVILNWLVHLFVGSCFARGTVVGGERGRGRRGRERRCRLFIFYILIFLLMRWKLNEAKGTPNVNIIKHSIESRRYASNLKANSFNFKYHITPKNTKC